jgi:hypothetical protein
MDKNNINSTFPENNFILGMRLLCGGLVVLVSAIIIISQIEFLKIDLLGALHGGYVSMVGVMFFIFGIAIIKKLKYITVIVLMVITSYTFLIVIVFYYKLFFDINVFNQPAFYIAMILAIIAGFFVFKKT